MNRINVLMVQNTTISLSITRAPQSKQHFGMYYYCQSTVQYVYTSFIETGDRYSVWNLLI